MSDLKSKLPDLKELGEIGGKLFKDLKASVTEIITAYKRKHPPETATRAAPAKNEELVKKAETSVTAKKETKPKKTTSVKKTTGAKKTSSAKKEK